MTGKPDTLDHSAQAPYAAQIAAALNEDCGPCALTAATVRSYPAMTRARGLTKACSTMRLVT